MRIKRFRHGTKSYQIIKFIFDTLFPAKNDLIVLDLTYGKGRFYRLVKNKIKTLIAVDIIKHDWEIKPNIFYNMSCIDFVNNVIENKMKFEKIDIIVVDPPWSSEKRGYFPKRIGISNMPYHMKINSKSIIDAAIKLSHFLAAPLLYRYKKHLSCNHILIIEAETIIMKRKGKVFYGVCLENYIYN
jgi:23S rRNA U2552 (ribose-2'-O)-methylase RlmE/FtsJ